MRVLSCGKPQEPGTILGMRLCEKMCYNRISIQMPCILMGLMPQRGTSPKVVSLGRLYVWTIPWPSGFSASSYPTLSFSRNLVCCGGLSVLLARRVLQVRDDEAKRGRQASVRRAHGAAGPRHP
jgi:hypothetical protein